MKKAAIVGSCMAFLIFAGAGCGSAPVTPPVATPEPAPAPSPAPRPVVTPPAATGYTKANVAKHASANDCWTIIRGKVYDITPYVPYHPGGDVILQACGVDGTSMFESRPGSGTPHPARAENILQQYYLGDLSV